MNFSYSNARQLVLEIVVALSDGQNTSQELNFKTRFIGMNSWQPCLLVQEVIYYSFVYFNFASWCHGRAIVLEHSFPQWVCKYIFNTHLDGDRCSWWSAQFL